MIPFPQDFYLGPTIEVAQKLLGCFLVHQSLEGTTIGKIVETEAYLTDDPASHSFKGKRTRNAAMFEAGGIAYVYQIYGLHYCFNVVAGPKESGEAVLIRALEPVEGIELMQTRRSILVEKNLCSGPAKLVQAMGITIDQNFQSLLLPPLFITAGEPVEFHSTKRVGIRLGADSLFRFYEKGSPFISRV